MEITARNELLGKGELVPLNITRGRAWGTSPYSKYRAGLADGVTTLNWNDLTDHDTDALTA